MHPRKRYIKNILLKRSKIFPVLGVLGPRQVGKSTFLMHEWCEEKHATYITFDEKEVIARAKQAPAQLLLSESNNQEKHLIIDEAQKVPHILDSIKAIVDKNRRIGAFTLSGSVEFSHKSGIRESLAGRMGITKLYPLTVRELDKNNLDLEIPWVKFDFNLKKKLDPKSIETWLIRGGMPIFCNLADTDERINLISSWVDAICFRDLQQLKDGHYGSEVALNLLISLAAEPHSISISKISSNFGVSHAAIKKHLEALESLFLIYKLPSFENPRASNRYILFDAGVLNALRGDKTTIFSRHMSLITLVVNEIYAQYEYNGKLKPHLFYYKSKGGAEIDLVLESDKKIIGIECCTSDTINPLKQRGMKSFLKKYKNAIGYFIAPVQKAYTIDENIHVIPWTCIG